MGLLDIHAVINYEKIAPILGLHPTNKLSGFLQCPFCSSYTWSLHQDNSSLEQWYYCANCKKTDTVLAMAAELLRLTEFEVVEYVSQYHNYSFKQDDISLLRKALSKANYFYEFWLKASKNLLHMSREHLGLLTGLDWNYFKHLDEARIVEGPGKLLGVTDSDAVYEHLKIRGLSRTQPIVAIPYFSSFQRIKGFQLRSPRLSHFKHCLIAAQRESKMDDGLAGLLLLDQFNSDIIVVTSMLDNMVHIQMRNFQSNPKPLPFLSWKQPCKSTQHPYWDVLAGKTLCFWERKPSAAMIYHAMKNNGYCTFLGPYKDKNSSRSQQWSDWVKDKPPISLYQNLVKHMVPVDKAVSNWLLIADKEEKNRLIIDAEQFDKSVLELVQSKLTDKAYIIPAKKVTAPLLNSKNPLSSKGSITIIERDGKWFDHTGALRFGGIIRIEQLVVYPNKDNYYVGYVENSNSKYPFKVSIKDANINWLKQFLEDNGIIALADPIDIYSKRRFSPFEVALRLHEPKVIHGVDRIGWDGTGFQFRNCKVMKGEFTETPEYQVVPDAPGPKRTESRLRSELVESIQDDFDEIRVCWALGISLCAQLTAPVVKLPTYGLFIIRADYDPFLHTLLRRFEIKDSKTQTWPHNWPRFIKEPTAAFRTCSNGFFATHGTSNWLVNNKQLVTVNVHSTALQPRLVPHSGEKIVMQYLKHFSADNHFRPETWQEWLDYTHTKMKTYFNFVNKDHIDKGRKLISLV